MPTQSKMLKSTEIAKRLSVSIRTVQHWIHEGILPAVRVSERGMWLVKEEDLEAAYRSNSLLPGRKRETEKGN